jgi:hypothetical protein
MPAQIRDARKTVDLEVLREHDEVRFGKELLPAADTRYLCEPCGSHRHIELPRFQLSIQRWGNAGPQANLM